MDKSSDQYGGFSADEARDAFKRARVRNYTLALARDTFGKGNEDGKKTSFVAVVDDEIVAVMRRRGREQYSGRNGKRGSDYYAQVRNPASEWVFKSGYYTIIESESKTL